MAACSGCGRGAFREVKVACVFDGRERAAESERRQVLLHPHYEAHLGGPERLGQRTYAAARAAGLTADGTDVVSQGDGAAWVWNLVQTHCHHRGDRPVPYGPAVPSSGSGVSVTNLASARGPRVRRRTRPGAGAGHGAGRHVTSDEQTPRRSAMRSTRKPAASTRRMTSVDLYIRLRPLARHVKYSEIS
jgi:hypothetical protein